jgi:hypothetical protein
MIKKNQYYRLIEHVPKENIAKVFNFRTNEVEFYLTVLTKKERLEQKKIQAKKLAKEIKIKKEKAKNDPIVFMYKAIKFNLYLYYGYSNLRLQNNNLIKSLILRRYLKFLDKSRYSHYGLFSFLTQLYGDYLKNSYLRHSKYLFPLNVISVHVIIRRSNIYTTVIKDNSVVKVLSPCIFQHISKRGKKKSMSFFYTVKRTIMYITRFFFNKRKKYFLKIFFKGFQKLRRPLLSRFLFNKRLKTRCIGIYNEDSEPFNGCRLRKSKRIQFRGQKKQGKRFSF